MATGDADTIARWLDLADENFEVSGYAFDKEHYRSCVSRAYYALYQAATAFMLHAGFRPPGPGNWTHERLATLFAEGPSRRVLGHKAIEFKQACIRTYDARVAADYRPTAQVDKRQARDARRHAGYVINKVLEVTDHGRR